MLIPIRFILNGQDIHAQDISSVSFYEERGKPATSIRFRCNLPYLPPVGMKVDLPHFEEGADAKHITVEVAAHHLHFGSDGKNEVLEVNVSLKSPLGGRPRSIKLTQYWTVRTQVVE